MASPVPLLWRVPAAAETRIGNPVLGRTLTGLAGALNHLNAVHVRGFAVATAYQAPAYPSADADDVGQRMGEVDRHETLYVPYRVPEAADWVHVSAWCLAYETGGTQSPEVTISVETVSGSSVDVGCTWTRAARTLPGMERRDRGRFMLAPFLIESSRRRNSTDPGGMTPTDPRQLKVGAEAGGVVIFKIASVRTSVVSFTIWPVPPESIP